MMRLGLVIYGDLETVSGGYLYDRKLVEHLQRRGDEVEVISLPWRNYAWHLLDNFSASLRRRFRAARFDVLLQDELNHPSLFWLNERIRRTLPYPIFSIVHHLRSSESRPAWQNRLYLQIERRYLCGVDGFILNSQTTRRAVEQNGVSLVSRPHLVAYPAGDQFAPQISVTEIARRASEPGPLRILFLGNLIPRKGLHTLLAALNQLPAGLCSLSVIGSQQVDPGYTRAVRRQIDRLGLADRVQMLGSLPTDALAACLRSHQMLAVPSTYEGYGIVYLEGMGFGLPAIATTGGAAEEIVTTGVDGYLIPPGAAAALAQCLDRLAHDRHLLRQMSLAARQRYLAQPTWGQTAGQIRAFLLARAQ
jgi:glycosyltransferase involved in cell wall biosynthesis